MNRAWKAAAVALAAALAGCGGSSAPAEEIECSVRLSPGTPAIEVQRMIDRVQLRQLDPCPPEAGGLTLKALELAGVQEAIDAERNLTLTFRMRQAAAGDRREPVNP